MSIDVEDVPCNLCGSDDTKVYVSLSYNDFFARRPELIRNGDPILENAELANYKFKVVKCKKCRLIYVNPRITEKYIHSLYQDEYFSWYAATNSEAHKLRESLFEVEAKELERIVPKGKIIDVGCGGGFWLNHLNNNWEKHGVEISNSAIDFAEKHFGYRFRYGTLENNSYPSDYFDVVKIRGTIEHVRDPATLLFESNRILRSGGIISLNTPNIGSLCARLYGVKFRQIEPLHHLYYFSKKTISDMLLMAGFHVIKVSKHYFDTPYANKKDFMQIVKDISTLSVWKNPYTASPNFYGTEIDVYARKI